MFKVVRVIDNRYFSYIDQIQYTLEYKINEFVTPKIGKIFCFDSETNAIRFINNEGYSYYELITIFKCEAIGKTKVDQIAIPTELNIRQFWNNNIVSLKNAPLGSYFCDSLKLVKEVKCSY